MKTILTFVLLNIAFNCNAQNYQWRPIVPGIDCIDSTFNNCQVSFLVNDTFHNTLWLLGIFEGGGGVSSAYAVGFDGTNWIPFPGIFNASILSYTNCAIMYNGNLILGKDDRIEEFNFSTLQWSTIGNSSSEVLCLAIFNNDLIAGGYFSNINGTGNHIAKWNGIQWDTLGSGITGSSHIVMSLEIYNGKLFAGGTFDFAGG
ncbi:hypothetical protein LBMAG27_10790 [Bacteroidota bacterium]|nr:hypothetical protein LBMAG27_10790 [Bacteroidota bacterium]